MADVLSLEMFTLPAKNINDVSSCEVVPPSHVCCFVHNPHSLVRYMHHKPSDWSYVHQLSYPPVN